MIPDHVTRQQLTDAFAAMGLDAGEILSWRGNAHDRYLELLMLPRGMPDAVESVLVKIPIHEQAPPGTGDLLGELQREGGEV